VARACDFIRQAALGLQHAHERGLVHRDVKPHNLLVAADGTTVKLLDMGLARLDPGNVDDHSGTMTQEGVVMGTPNYMAPEQAMGTHAVDILADLYSLGCTFYQLLAGDAPFPTGTLLEKIDKHRHAQPPRLEIVRPEVPPAVAAVVRKLMAKKPEDRYQTPGEVAAALAAQLLQGPEPVLVGSVEIIPRSLDDLRPLVDGVGNGAAQSNRPDPSPSKPLADVPIKRVAQGPRSGSGIAAPRLIPVDCPGCGRKIPLRENELTMLIECAACDTRFYPVQPLDETLSSNSCQARARVPGSDTFRQEPTSAEPGEVPLAPPRPRPRRKRKKQDWVPLIRGLALSAVLLAGLAIGLFVLAKAGIFNSRRPAPGEPTGAGKVATPPSPTARDPDAGLPAGSTPDEP
jgi:serine/threonine protein kinase